MEIEITLWIRIQIQIQMGIEFGVEKCVEQAPLSIGQRFHWVFRLVRLSCLTSLSRRCTRDGLIYMPS